MSSGQRWESGDIDAGGIGIHYHRTGGGKPPVVLAHGITDNGLCWTRVARALETDYDLIMVDARGHGDSDKPASGYGPRDHAGDLAAVIRQLGLDRPVVMGHSMGAGSTAALLAAYPGLASGAVLEDPPWRMPGQEAANQNATVEWAQRIAKRKLLTPEQLRAEGHADNPLWSDEEFAPWIDAKYKVSPNVVEYVGRNRTPWTELVAQFVEPVLLVRGDPECGGIIGPDQAEQAVALNPRVTVAHLPGAGHNVRREQFDGYVSAVRSFLQTTLGR
jgi:pimeloyl-ACP methyl ester carboxylesterase